MIEFAYAATTPGNTPAAGGGMSSIVLIVLMVAIFYFMLIRPESKRKKQAEEMRSSLQKGDWLTTIGGVYGRVVAITDRTVVIETSEDRVRIEFLKSAIGSVGTLDEQAAAAQRGSRKAKKGAEAEKPVEAPVEAPAEETPAEPTEDVVMPTNQALTVNGEAVTGAQVYNINGSNYFKLRDVAALLNGTGSQFALEYDAAAREIVLTTGEAYTPDGSELTAGEDQSATAVRSNQSLTIDGESASLTAYNIGGNNYFMLRDLGEALGFEVDYDAAARTMIINSK